MTKAQIVVVDNVEIPRHELQTVKRLFRIVDNAEAVRKAVDIASGVIELETIIRKNKGVKIETVYA
jgi:hypothetical protein